ncbi:arylsulfatase [Xanthocytophaga flava]|uniref:arylsulfatase n=1 Tax=Xanthocytophaga flava TaxID=3048013 RepID=UPI0028D63D4A|nr:arylsulfatase [Xanthocytophaga flavus]MDJ1467727.1 arylsulfatase [Xanthocytophaga flavus]
MKHLYTYITFSILLVLYVSAYGTGVSKPKPAKPNIVLILVDDMGFSDIGAYGSEIPTPNLDKLANNGVRFTQFYNTSRCCPTRAALQSGVYPHQAGVGSMNGNLGIPAYQGYLNKNIITIAEGLKTQGYTTLMSGKWHIGNTLEQWPGARGYDKYFALIGGTSHQFYPHPYKLAEINFFVKNGQKLESYTTDKKPDSYYLTDEFTDQALGFLDETKNTNKPFFLFTAYNAPHFPIQARKEDIEKYKGKYMQGWDVVRTERYKRLVNMGVIRPEWKLSPRDTLIPGWDQLRQTEKEAWDLKMAVYAAMIDRLDYNIGRILAKLTELGVDKNTYIFFLSDNGASHEYAFSAKSQTPEAASLVKPLTADNPQSYVSYEYNWANVSNTPFRSFKHWEHEGGISTPFIAYAPGKIQAGGLVPAPAHVIDIQPTIFDLAGVKYPQTYKGNTLISQEGISFKSALDGKEWKGNDIIFWEHQGNRAVRQGDWKIVSFYPENKWELYNIKEDRTELHNLASSNPAKLQELINLYNAWARRAGVVEWETLVKKTP